MSQHSNLKYILSNIQLPLRDNLHDYSAKHDMCTDKIDQLCVANAPINSSMLLSNLMIYCVSAASHKIAMDTKLLLPLLHDNWHEPHKNPFRNNCSFHKGFSKSFRTHSVYLLCAHGGLGTVEKTVG